ncbi:hypothetical protein EGJ27_12505 [Pseudomonas sp. v388]|nr:hypothetical protein EGJ27_12505 [Pseudomonas sp. v388]
MMAFWGVAFCMMGLARALQAGIRTTGRRGNDDMTKACQIVNMHAVLAGAFGALAQASAMEMSQ